MPVQTVDFIGAQYNARSFLLGVETVAHKFSGNYDLYMWMIVDGFPACPDRCQISH